jgi:hypothetical protein
VQASPRPPGSDCAPPLELPLHETGRRDFDSRGSVLVLIPVRLGLHSLEPCYTTPILRLLELPYCVGILGGRRSHSCYYFGTELLLMLQFCTRVACTCHLHSYCLLVLLALVSLALELIALVSLALVLLALVSLALVLLALVSLALVSLCLHSCHLHTYHLHLCHLHSCCLHSCHFSCTRVACTRVACTRVACTRVACTHVACTRGVSRAVARDAPTHSLI